MRGPAERPVNEEEPSGEELKPMVQPPPVAPAVSIRKAFRRFWPYTRGVRRLFVVGVLFAILAAALRGRLNRAVRTHHR